MMDMIARRGIRWAALVCAAGCLLAGCRAAVSGDGALTGQTAQPQARAAAPGQLQAAGMPPGGDRAQGLPAPGEAGPRLRPPGTAALLPVPLPPASRLLPFGVVPLPSPTPGQLRATPPLYGPPAPSLEPEGPPAPRKGEKRTAYLTFDDGPSGSTRTILDILRKHEVKATFFVVGSETAEAKALYRQIAAEGHALGNHTYSHDYRRIYKSPDAFKQDVAKLDRLLEETVGIRPDILRFPGGSNNHLSRKAGGRGIMKSLAREVTASGYTYFDWNVSSTDAAAPVQDREMIIQSVLGASQGKRSIIVLMHDNTFKTTTVEALPVVIRKLKAMGFQFEKLTSASFVYHFLEP